MVFASWSQALTVAQVPFGAAAAAEAGVRASSSSPIRRAERFTWAFIDASG